MPIRPFRISVPDDDIEDLHRRLDRTRWPSAFSGAGWEDGADALYLRELVRHWRHRYDWREREAALNRHEHRIADIDGVDIHFIHAKGQGPSPVPLLLLHGWPSSFVQMLSILPLLTEARDDGTPCFDVVAASLPGYPFTSFPDGPGMGFARMATLMTRLMVEELGYERFAARGTDQGGLVQRRIALATPERLIGLHRSGVTPFASPMPTDLSPAEVEYQRQAQEWAPRETLYARLQAQRPETLAPALSDSPVALASWFIEKFQRWGDTRAGVDAAFGRDRLLDNLSLHWFTGAGAASVRIYREAIRDLETPARVEVPTAIMVPLNDAVNPPAPREWAERSYNVARWTVMERGGHFPEWEAPDVVADDIRAFFAQFV
ncbi:epoxide hydrolase family protein [Alsobacter sp. KACC 23698]|uniref:Epoxide hydrolase family protein n=1 Tax=Alsobacter sp. KACC 23698 TaxID=3149229 RepID=A0AAU7JEA4_9HYPH